MFRYVLALVVATIAVGTAAAAPPDPFAGAWIGTDPFDGGTLRLQISMDAHGVRHVVFTDSRTRLACGGPPGRIIGSGTVSGATLTWSGTVRCLGITGGAPAGPFTLVATNGTLVETAGPFVIVYTREPG